MLYWLRLLPFWLLCGMLVCSGMLAPFTTVGAMAFIPEIVSVDMLSEANAWDEILWQAAYLAGPLLGGILIGSVGAPFAILVDGLSFWVCALCFERLYARDDVDRIWSRRNRGDCVGGICAYGWASRVLDECDGSWDGYEPHPNGLDTWPMATDHTHVGCGFLFWTVCTLARTIVQKRMPNDLRGRVFGIRTSIIGIGVPAGSALCGVVLQTIRPSVWIGAIGVTILAFGVGMLACRGLVSRTVNFQL